MGLTSHIGQANSFLETCSFRVLGIPHSQMELYNFDFVAYQACFGGWGENDALLGLCTFEPEPEILLFPPAPHSMVACDMPEMLSGLKPKE